MEENAGWKLHSRSDILRRAGLSIVEATLDGPTSVSKVWKEANSATIVPDSVVSLDSPELHSLVDQLWAARCRALSIFSPDDTFLISVGNVGSPVFGWARVRYDPASRLAGTLGPGRNHSDFLAMSEDGRCFCGVSTEEYEVWVVSGPVRS